MGRSPGTARAVERGVVLLAFIAAAVLVVFPLQDFDTFWHLANGRAMLWEGRAVNEELFSYTRGGAPFHNHEWLAQIVLYAVYAEGGALGLLLLKLAIALGVACFIYLSCRVSGADALIASTLVVFAFLASYKRYVERPELFSFLFLSALGYLLYAARDGRVSPAWLWAAPPVMVVWDFLHGAVYGVIYFGAFLLGETAKGRVHPSFGGKSSPLFLKRLWIVAAVTAAAMLANPYGLRSYGMFFKYAGGSAEVVRNLEFGWTPLVEFGLFWFLLGFTAMLMLALTRKIDTVHLFIVMPFALLAIRYNRASAIFAIVVCPVLAYYLAHAAALFKGASERFLMRGYLHAMLLAGFAAVVAVKIPSAGYQYGLGTGLYEGHFPVGAVEHVRENGIRGNMYNTGHIGGYLAYTLYPERRIFLYNHTNVFGGLIARADDPGVLEEYGVDYAFVTRAPEGCTMECFPPWEWEEVYSDDVASVMVRRTSWTGNDFPNIR